MSEPTAEQIFRTLISFDTTSSRSNRELADYICELLDGRAAAIERDISEDGTKLNLMLRLGPEVTESRSGLVLSGHMDTVPAVETGWDSNPFELHDGGDRWSGRGTADMKGFLALTIDLARRIDPAALCSPLVLLFTYDEEVGTLGAKHWIDHQAEHLLPKAAVIGEPTELRVVRMHKGHLKLQIRLRGVSAHSGYPHLGVNAIERAGAVIEALGELRVELEGERTEDSRYFEPVPWVPLNIGEIQGGTAINIVPDRCDLSLGIRLLPGVSRNEIVSRLDRKIRSAISDPSAVEVTLINESPPMKLPEDADLLRDLCEMTGQDETRAVSFATDAGWFQSLGLECVLFGPGSIEVAHKPNEYIPKDQFLEAAGILDALTRKLCLGERE